MKMKGLYRCNCCNRKTGNSILFYYFYNSIYIIISIFLVTIVTKYIIVYKSINYKCNWQLQICNRQLQTKTELL